MILTIIFLSCFATLMAVLCTEYTKRRLALGGLMVIGMLICLIIKAVT